jgi:hypothetical protein
MISNERIIMHKRIDSIMDVEVKQSFGQENEYRVAAFDRIIGTSVAG